MSSEVRIEVERECGRVRKRLERRGVGKRINDQGSTGMSQAATAEKANEGRKIVEKDVGS